MATNSVDLFSYFADVQISSDDILKAELLAYQAIKAKFPTLDLREGTGLRDLNLRPVATLMAMTNNALMLYFQNNTVADLTDSSPTTFVDKLMSNWFQTRKTGEKAVINARLFFARSKSVSIGTDIYFSTDNTLKYFPAGALSFSSSQLTYDAGTNTYYIDVDLTAESAGTSYNITSGSLIYFSNFDAYFLHAEINFLRTSASDPETNTVFVSRVKDSISTRNLINVPSISSNLLANFSMITEVASVGYGDPYMVRDSAIISAAGNSTAFWAHLGGCVDIYCRVPIASSILQFTTDSLGKVYLTGPIYRTVRSTVSGGSTADTMPVGQAFTISNDNWATALVGLTSSGTTATVTWAAHGMTVGETFQISGASPAVYNGQFEVVSVSSANTFTFTLPSATTSPATGSPVLQYVSRRGEVGFSTRQSQTLDFGVGQANKTVSLVLYYFQNIDGIQEYLTLDENRVLCSDQIARGFNLTLLDVSLVGYNEAAPNTTVAATAISTYLATLKAGQPFIMADMVSALNAAGLTSLKTPIGVTYTQYARDLFVRPGGSITDIMQPGDTTNVFLLNSVTSSAQVI